MAEAVSTRVFLCQGRSTGTSHYEPQGCTAGFVALHCSRAVSSVYRITVFCTGNCNASVSSTNGHLERAQILGEQLRCSSRNSLSMPSRSKARRAAVLDNQFTASYRISVSHCLLCAGEGQALSSRLGSSFFQDRLRRRRGKTKARNPGCVGNSAAGLMAVKPFLDQVLLLGTVFGVYIAGVASLPRLPQVSRDTRALPARPDSSRSHKSVKREPIQQQKPGPESPEYAGNDGWGQLQFKLSQAMPTEATPEVDDGKVVKSPILGLQALARVPRLNLLLTTLQHLRNEVGAIGDAEQYVDLMQWQELSLSVLSRSVAPICRDWLSQDLWQTRQSTDVGERVLTSAGVTKPLIHKEELLLQDVATNTKTYDQRGDVEFSNSMEVNVLDSMMVILKESESIQSYLTRGGKAGLYADLIFFLRFGSARLRGCCDHRVFKKHTGNILEDMVVAVAEVVATLFLDSSSLASLSPHGEMWQTFLLPSILTSRSLERFRNEVALYGWLNQNFTSVAAMFEDRFDLWTVQTRSILRQGHKQGKSLTKKPVNIKIGVKSDDLVLTRSQLPARRSTELKALIGWRYYYSLFLELSDVVGPLLSILLSKLGDALSFLLITLIGRSLGLVYQGICQSVRWPLNRKDETSQ